MKNPKSIKMRFLGYILDCGNTPNLKKHSIGIHFGLEKHPKFEITFIWDTKIEKMHPKLKNPAIWDFFEAIKAPQIYKNSSLGFLSVSIANCKKKIYDICRNHGCNS